MHDSELQVFAYIRLCGMNRESSVLNEYDVNPMETTNLHVKSATAVARWSRSTKLLYAGSGCTGSIGDQ